jgi:UPF0755 protein
MKKMKKSNKLKKIELYIFLACVAFVLIGALAVLIHYSSTPINPYGNKDVMVIVDIPTGSSFVKVTEILNKAGLIKSRYLFYCLALTRQATRSIRAGEYEFSDSMTPGAVLGKLLRGEVKPYPVTIFEDLTTKEIAELLMKDRLIDEKEFFALAYDRDFLNSLGIKAKSIEGYLFPETYKFDRSMSTRQIMKIMVSLFWKRVTPEMVKRAEEIGFNINQFVTFASIVGKESGNRPEKPMISAVFHNRIKKRMPLQSDPTAVYDLEDFSGKVMRSHLKRKSPYNTYLIRGLPPGPIANPGIDSLNATLNPAQVNYLYFVSKKDGTHQFSASLDMHNKAIKQYHNIKYKKQ